MTSTKWQKCPSPPRPPIQLQTVPQCWLTRCTNWSWQTQHKGFWFYQYEGKELPCTQQAGCALGRGWNILPCSVLRYTLLFKRQPGYSSLQTRSMIQDFKRLEIRQSLTQHPKVWILLLNQNQRYISMQERLQKGCPKASSILARKPCSWMWF